MVIIGFVLTFAGSDPNLPEAGSSTCPKLLSPTFALEGTHPWERSGCR